MSFDTSYSYDESIYSHESSMSLFERLGYVKQLVFSRTKLEFRLLWNKIFQKQDEELGWLLNPYRQSSDSNEATMMASFNKNIEDSYQASSLGGERVTIYSRGLVKKGDSRRRRKEKKSIGESALQVARYMGMGVYMTTTSFPSPFLPVNDNNLAYDEGLYYGRQDNVYTMSRLW